ncbi:hypothetical protein N9S22_01925 [Paracoccaceae bacterium]|nr:hypothetical protein [Paracoccaceae bacterium]
MQSALSIIGPFGILIKILIGDMNVDKELHQKGSYDATTAIGSAYQKLKQDDPHQCHTTIFIPFLGAVLDIIN